MSDTRIEADDGTPIDVTIRGSGPALVLLHGWTAEARDWLPAVELLSGHFRCMVWSARPHVGAGDTGIERMADDLAALLRQLAPDGAVVCGHSMGAMTVMEYVRRHGTRGITALSLIDQAPRLLTGPGWEAPTWGRFTDEDNRRFVDALHTDFVGTVLDLVAHSRLPDAGGDGPGIDQTFLAARRRRLAAMAAAPWIRTWQSFIGKDYRADLGGMDVPTLLVFGGRSRYFAAPVAAYMRERIPDAELRVYESAGHGPHVEQPERFCRDMRRLASRAAGAGAG